MSKRNLTKLAQQIDLDEIEDVLDEEERPCRSTRTSVPKDTSGMKFERSRTRKRQKESVRRAREEKEKFHTGERSPQE